MKLVYVTNVNVQDYISNLIEDHADTVASSTQQVIVPHFMEKENLIFEGMRTVNAINRARYIDLLKIYSMLALEMQLGRMLCATDDTPSQMHLYNVLGYFSINPGNLDHFTGANTINRVCYLLHLIERSKGCKIHICEVDTYREAIVLSPDHLLPDIRSRNEMSAQAYSTSLKREWIKDTPDRSRGSSAFNLTTDGISLNLILSKWITTE